MNLPISNRLKKRAQRDVATLEDVFIKIIYDIDNTAEIHGGTVVWRCFGGRRFSKDIDVYLQSRDELETLKSKIKETTERYGAKMLKFKDTGNLIFAEFILGDIYSEIDINYKSYYKEYITRNYENVDGSFYEILIPPPEKLLLEKIEAYKDRTSITDLYDMRILADFVDVKLVGKQLKEFLDRIKRPDNKEEERLKDLVYEGPIPSFTSLVKHLEEKMQ